jgi:hypothetical protein
MTELKIRSKGSDCGQVQECRTKKIMRRQLGVGKPL